MPPRLRTLPDRHGGRVVLGLLIAILALGLALRVQAALTPVPPASAGNDAAAYMAIAKGLYTEGHYGGPSQSSPNDWSPGAPLLYAGVYLLTGGVSAACTRSASPSARIAISRPSTTRPPCRSGSVRRRGGIRTMLAARLVEACRVRR